VDSVGAGSRQVLRLEDVFIVLRHHFRLQLLAPARIPPDQGSRGGDPHRLRFRLPVSLGSMEEGNLRG